MTLHYAAVSPLEEISVQDFDLELTLRCGQVFHWQRASGGYIGVIDRTPIYVEQRGNTLWATPGTAGILSRYLALDHPLQEIYATLPTDAGMIAALRVCLGLRIIRQPLWECLATFITSALKQVAHIAQISHCLRTRFGEVVGAIEDQVLYAYPTIEKIAGLQEAELRACGLGFRATSLLATARKLLAGDGGGDVRLEALRAMSRADALAALTEFRGVGTKVANCVLLFGYGHLDAFPVDVWIERVLRETYFRAEPGASLADLQRFAEGYFGPYGGYAQQYLFHHARVVSSKAGRSREDAQTPDDAEKPMRRIAKPRNRAR